MSRQSDAIIANATRVFLCAVGVGAALVFILSLPELKRYIKISTM